MIRRLAALLTLLLVLSACANSGQPTGFDQQPVPLSDELQAAIGGDVTTLPVVERNFLEGCVLAERPRIAAVSDLTASCQCAYDAIVDFYRSNSTGETPEAAERAAFDNFKELNDALESADGVIPANIQALLDGCAT